MLEFVGFNFHYPSKGKKIKEDYFVLTVLQQSVLEDFILRPSQATGGFSESNIIGVGSYDYVYKGVLDQDTIAIVVKVFNLQGR